MPLTSPDNISYSDTSTTMDPNAISSATATSVQEALKLRQRYEFVWANSTARTGQIGMVAGSTGYQLDTKSEYIYESGVWRLKLSYAEYTMATGFSVAPSTFTLLSPLAINATTSTDTTFTSMTGGVLNVVQPGVYSFSLIAGMTNGAFTEITTDVAHTQIIGLGGFTFGVSQSAVPFFRTTVANQSIYIWIFHTQATAQVTSTACTFRVGRLG